VWLNREVAKRLYAVRDLSKQIDAVQADTANKKDTVQPSGAVTVTTPSDKEMSPPVYVQAVCVYVCMYVCIAFFSQHVSTVRFLRVHLTFYLLNAAQRPWEWCAAPCTSCASSWSRCSTPQAPCR